jgi:hypothetical protein
VSVTLVVSALASAVEAALAYPFYRSAVLGLIAPCAFGAVVVALALIARGLRGAGAPVAEAAGQALVGPRATSGAECSTRLAGTRAKIAEQIWTVPARSNVKGRALPQCTLARVPDRYVELGERASFVEAHTGRVACARAIVPRQAVLAWLPATVEDVKATK